MIRYYDESDLAAPEIELPKGDVTEGVVRVGNTVRRPHQPTSFAVAGYLDHLERVGFDGAPRYLGRDGHGRDVLTYLEGCVPGDPPEQWATTQELLASVAELLRRLHEASAGYLADAGFAAPYGAVWHRDRVRVDVPDPSLPPPELVSHCDVTPQNVVVRAGRAVGLVDFDMAGPAARLLDVVNTAMWWVALRHPHHPAPPLRSLGVPPTPWPRIGARWTSPCGCGCSPTRTGSTAAAGRGSRSWRSPGRWRRGT